MGARKIFSRGGQITGLGTKVPQQGLEMEPGWGLKASPPEADDRLWKYCINNSSTERFAVTTNAQKHYTTLPEGGGASAPSCPCLRAPLTARLKLMSDNKFV